MGLWQSVPADDPRVVDHVREWRQKRAGTHKYSAANVPPWDDSDVDAFAASAVGKPHAALIARMRSNGQTCAASAAALGGFGFLSCFARSKNPAIALAGGVLGGATGFVVASSINKVQYPDDKQAFQYGFPQKGIKACRAEFLDWHIARSAKKASE